jgi:divalent metal cation (Fe/Co/Zn/Cd) transporter
MSVEAAVSLWAAWAARSPALLAFGGDSAVELLSATVVLWRFRAHPVQERAEKRASRIAGILLFVLAAYVVAAAALTLLGYSEPKPIYLGIAILIAAAAITPWIANRLRKNGLRDLDSLIREGFWLHPLVSRGFIFGPASTLRPRLTSLESPDSSYGLSCRPRPRR